MNTLIENKKIIFLLGLLLLFTLKIFSNSPNTVVFAKSNFSKNENIFTSFKDEANRKINKIFIKYDGNWHSKTAFYPQKIEFFNKDQLIHSYNSKFELRTGYYETMLGNYIDTHNLTIKFYGKDYKISNILLIDNKNNQKINLIEKIFNPKNLNEFSYIIYTFILFIYFIFFCFFLIKFFYLIFKINLDYIYAIPFFIIGSIFLNLLNLFLPGIIFFFNLFLIIFIFYFHKNFISYLYHNRKFLLFVFVVFLAIQMPIIIRDFQLNYFGFMKFYLYENSNLYLKNNNFLGYHLDSNLIWVTSKVLQNIDNYKNAKEIFFYNFIPFQDIANRPFVFHLFFSYFYELFNNNHHFFFVRLQYFFLTIVYATLFLIVKKKLNFNYSLLLVILIIFNPAVHFNSFPSFEIINKVYAFLFFVVAIFLAEKGKINLSMFLILFCGLLHITGLFYSIVFSFFLYICKKLNIYNFIKCLIFLFPLIYFHYNLQNIAPFFFDVEIKKNLYISRLLSDLTFIELLKIRLINFANAFIPFFNVLEIGKVVFSSSNTIFYCLTTFYFFFIIRDQSEDWYDFILKRIFVVSPILINILFLNEAINWGVFVSQWFIFTFYLILIYFFLYFKNKFFFRPCVYIYFFIITYINLSELSFSVLKFNSKEAYFILITLYFLHFFLIFFIFKIFKKIDA